MPRDHRRCRNHGHSQCYAHVCREVDFADNFLKRLKSEIEAIGAK